MATSEAIQYPYLPKGRSIKYVPESNEFMRAAKESAREHSTDRQMPTGAVLVRDNIIIARGANKVLLHHPLYSKWHQNGLCTRRIFGVPSGQKYWLCPGCASPKDHAEQQVVREAHRLLMETKGADLYLWGHWWCCEPCWNAMIGAGVRDVYLLEQSEMLFNKNHPEHIIGRQFKI